MSAKKLLNLFRAAAVCLAVLVSPAARAEECAAVCRADNTACQQKCSGPGVADCRSACVHDFFDCRCECGERSYCAVSDPRPGCRLLAQKRNVSQPREASAVSGRRPASMSMRASSGAPSGRAKPKSRR